MKGSRAEVPRSTSTVVNEGRKTTPLSRKATASKTARGAAAGGRGGQRKVVAGQIQQADWKAAERADFLIQAYGGVTKLADALGVAKSQPGRWRDGDERPGAIAAKKLLDLDHVMGRAILVWAPEVATRWMGSSNAFLGGAKPIEVLIARGPNDVIDALDATMSGAFA